MKIKIFLLISFIFICFGSAQNSYALPTKMPLEHTQQMSEEELNQQTENIFAGFFSGLIRCLKGEEKTIPIKSKDIKQLSSTIDSYAEQEAKNNPSFRDSHSEEKLNFGTAILNIIASILSIFSL